MRYILILWMLLLSVLPIWGDDDVNSAALHYWDAYNFADSTLVTDDITEQGWVNFLELLTYTDTLTAHSAARQTILRSDTSAVALKRFYNLAYRYLYEPNATYKNESLYAAIARCLLLCHHTGDARRQTLRYQLHLIAQNRVGTPANDFQYTLWNGRKSRLYKIRTPYTLLFFNNPGCGLCATTVQKLKESVDLSIAVQRKQITVLSLYPDDDPEEWRKHHDLFPATWYYACHPIPNLYESDLYDLRSIPSLYLLDAHHEVLLKDVDVDELLEYLKTLPTMQSSTR